MSMRNPIHHGQGCQKQVRIHDVRYVQASHRFLSVRGLRQVPHALQGFNQKGFRLQLPAALGS